MESSSSRNGTLPTEANTSVQESTVERFGGFDTTPTHMRWLPPRDRYSSNSVYSSSYNSCNAMQSFSYSDSTNSLSGPMAEFGISGPAYPQTNIDTGDPQHNEIIFLPSAIRNESPSFQENSIDPDGDETHPTPRILGWSPGTRFIELYKFVVLKGKEPYLELHPEFQNTPETPQRVFLDRPSENYKGVYPCVFPGVCLSKNGEPSTFSRPANLERHYIQVHSSNAFPCDYPCDYRKCMRAKDPFTRKDHYRDHLRDYHKEDLGFEKQVKRSGTNDKKEQQKWEAQQAKWLAERSINSNYWRCAKCLIKIHIAYDGWECHSCNQFCEPARIKARQKLIGAEQPTMSYASCQSCGGAAWIESIKAPTAWEPCPNC